MGSVHAYVAHPHLFDANVGSAKDSNISEAWGAWEFFLMGKLQFTEQFGLDVGLQAFLGDNAEPATADLKDGSFSFDSLWTIFEGLRFSRAWAISCSALETSRR